MDLEDDTALHESGMGRDLVDFWNNHFFFSSKM